jgi:hypothetical protein
MTAKLNNSVPDKEPDATFEKVAVHLFGYRPKKSSFEIYTVMQHIALNAGKTVSEMAQELGFSCGYEWMKAIKEAEA